MIKNKIETAKIKRKEILTELKERGITYDMLGLIFRISRQRIFQIIKSRKHCLLSHRYCRREYILKVWINQKLKKI